MKKLALSLLITILLTAPALAGSTTWGYTPGSGLNFGATTDSGGNLYSNGAIVDGANAANKATVDSNLNLHVTGPVTSSLAIPTSTLALPATTTAYPAGSLMCPSAVVATCNTALTSQTLSIGAAGENIARLELNINDSTSPGWTGQTINIDLWYAAPTFQTTGDRGVFVTDFLTGSANHIGTFTCVLGSAAGDGIYGECTPLPGNSIEVVPASGSTVFWTATAVSPSGTTGASKILTIKAEAAK